MNAKIKVFCSCCQRRCRFIKAEGDTLYYECLQCEGVYKISLVEITKKEAEKDDKNGQVKMF